MRLHAIRWTPYQVPLRLPEPGGPTYRSGAVLAVVTDDAVVGFGDAAPWPNPSSAELEQGLTWLRAVSPLLLGQFPDPSRLPPARAVPGELAARLALETALTDLQAQAQGVPLANWLRADAGWQVPVTVRLADADTARLRERAAAAVALGYRCLDVVLGPDDGHTEAVTRVAEARRVASGVEMRVVANGRWSRKVAAAALRGLDEHGIGLCIQPLDSDDLEGLAQLRLQKNVAVGAEVRPGQGAWVRQALALDAVDALLVRPAALGGLRAAFQLAEEVRACGVTPIVSAPVESGIGVATALHLAAALPGPHKASSLQPSGVLQSTLLSEELTLRDGLLEVPVHVGLGVSADARALERFALMPAVVIRRAG